MKCARLSARKLGLSEHTATRLCVAEKLGAGTLGTLLLLRVVVLLQGREGEVPECM